MKIVEGDFEWCSIKNDKNIHKHRMELKAGIPVFDDLFRIEYLDDRQARDEDRYLTIGYNAEKRLLSVCFTERLQNNRTRLISVRPASRKERRRYSHE